LAECSNITLFHLTIPHPLFLQKFKIYRSEPSKFKQFLIQSFELMPRLHLAVLTTRNETWRL